MSSNQQHQPNNNTRSWIAAVLSNKTVTKEFTASEIKQIIETAEREGVTSLLRHHLKQSEQLNNVPDALQKQLKTLETRHLTSHLVWQHEIQGLMQQLQQQGLEFIVMKGEALSHRVYLAPYMRIKCDTDLLFRNKQDTDKVWQILQQRSYRRLASLQGKFVGFQYACFKDLPSGVTVGLDIHNEINNYLWFVKRLPFDELLNNSSLINMDGVEARALNPVYALIHCCIHRITNRSKEMQNKLIWLYDIHLLSQNFSTQEWQHLLKACQTKNFGGIVFQGLKATQQALSTALPETTMNELEQLANIEPESFTAGDRRINLYLKDLLTNKGFTNKAQQLIERLFPPVDYMNYRYKPSNKIWLPYYYLKRIVDVIIRK